TVSYENHVCIGTCTTEPCRATNEPAFSIANLTSPSQTTHHTRVSGWSIRGVLLPAGEKIHSLRRCWSSTTSSRQVFAPSCLAFTSASFVCALCGGRYCAGFPLGAHITSCADADTAISAAANITFFMGKPFSKPRVNVFLPLLGPLRLPRGPAACSSGFLGRYRRMGLVTLCRGNARPGTTRRRARPKRCLRSRSYEVGFAGALEKAEFGTVFPGQRATQLEGGFQRGIVDLRHQCS